MSVRHAYTPLLRTAGRRAGDSAEKLSIWEGVVHLAPLTPVPYLIGPKLTDELADGEGFGSRWPHQLCGVWVAAICFCIQLQLLLLVSGDAFLLL